MAKNDWVSVFYTESREKHRETELISWMSSSSEDESYSFNKKKRKTVSKGICQTSPVVTFQRNNLLSTNQSHNISKPARVFDSPVLGMRPLELYKVSPELPVRSPIFVKELSPVLEKRRVRLKKRQKSKENHEKRSLSPDLFTESTQDIISESPEGSSTWDYSCSQATIKIEPFPSQFSSQVNNTDITLKNVSLYYEPPKPKKNFKKGSLSYQLDKALKLKKTRVNIWHHEKVKSMDEEFKSQEDIIVFKLKETWNEYGNTLLLCEQVHAVNCKSDSVLKSRDIDSMFLINVGSNSILSIKWEKNSAYRLYAPYIVDRVIYHGKEILCYSNVSKFIEDTLFKTGSANPSLK